MRISSLLGGRLHRGKGGGQRAVGMGSRAIRRRAVRAGISIYRCCCGIYSRQEEKQTRYHQQNEAPKITSSRIASHPSQRFRCSNGKESCVRLNCQWLRRLEFEFTGPNQGNRYNFTSNFDLATTLLATFSEKGKSRNMAA